MGELRPFVRNFVLSSVFWDLNVYIWRILREKGAQKHGFIGVKKNIPAEIIDLRHI